MLTHQALNLNLNTSLSLAAPGTTPEELERKLYKFACNYTVRVCLESVSNIGDDFLHQLYVLQDIGVQRSANNRTSSSVLPAGRSANPTMVTALALVHSRFSTNVYIPTLAFSSAFPLHWVHNGEINTVRGNLNWMKSGVKRSLESDLFIAEIDMLLPICQEGSSDSSNFDMALELLVLSGRTLPHALMMMIPEAWQETRYAENFNPSRVLSQKHAERVMGTMGMARVSVCFTDGVRWCNA
ncbi:hypothetical protein O9992_12000 [Vibrio lentus]|nr:hypothetical protein [Vibrio lentus]